MLRTLITSCLAVGLAAGVARAQSPAADSLTSHLQRLAERSQLPGFAVAVVDSGGIRYEHGFGLADKTNHVVYTPQTVQEIGSVSKTLIGVCLMKGVELGYFTLDTPINDVLPWPVTNPHRPKSIIRIRHLATHTSGICDQETTYLPAYIYGERAQRLRFEGAAPPNEQAAPLLGEYLRAYLTPGGAHYVAANFAKTRPGDAYAYSNIGAALAGYLIEVKSGMPYAAFVRRYVLTPSGMQVSGFDYPALGPAAHATPYRPDGTAYDPYVCQTYPDGGLHTSAHDLGLYLRQIIRGAAGRPGLLTTASFQTLLAPQFPETGRPKNRPAKEPNSGIFWARRANGTIGHTGGDPGVTTFMFFDPKTGIGRIFLTNVDFDDQPALVQQFQAIWKALGAWEGKL